MNVDVAGRVRNVPLPSSKPLLPLFEAIMNSIHGIEDAGEEDGRIEIEVVRDKSLFSGLDRSQADIVGFVIRDNGIGFDEQNFNAFSTSDTTFKASRGGKGVGRFLWLEAFDTVDIVSVFGKKNAMTRREFSFRLTGNAIENERHAPTADQERSTEIRLMGFKEKYCRQCPKRIDTIARFIIEEFLEHFIGPNRPSIVLREAGATEILSLDEVFDTEMVPKIERRKIRVRSQTVEILHVRLYSSHVSEHRVYFCAHERVVLTEKLSGKIPNLVKRLPDQGTDGFVYAAYVNSAILDDSVNSERTGFNLPEESTGLLQGEISLNEIRTAVYNDCKAFIAPYTAPIAQTKRDRIERFMQNDGIMYRPIIGRLQSAVDRIEPDANEDQIDQQLYQGYRELQVGLREQGRSLLALTPTAGDGFEEFEERFNDYFEEITEVSQADLARYVCHRKAIIEFLGKQLEVQGDGKYPRETLIHNIIFPRGKTSDQVAFDEHNLWLIDECLAFHVFLSSDQPISRAQALENTSRKEPDILVFDKAFAFSETPDVPFTSITILEFKKPQRDEYTEGENPCVQVARYIDEIRSGKAKTSKGRPIPIPPNLPFYCYVVCDITPNIKEWARIFELQETPDQLGFFGYKRSYNAYFEIISYSKLEADARKRNKAFFEKLGLP